MPQLFQVLKCFKCSVFQVHQTKKSNKWQCKLCGEKQSMKRHYGLGTGKECRLHVQKLNGIRGELDENNETTELYESSDEENQLKNDAKVTGIKLTNNLSKWSDFVDKDDKVPVNEPNEPMYLGNSEVVLEVPTKKRKFTKPRSIPNTNPSHSNDFNNFGHRRKSPSPPPMILYETDVPNISENNILETDKRKFINAEEANRKKPEKQPDTNFALQKINKNSKWAPFADDEKENSDDDNFETNDADEPKEINPNIVGNFQNTEDDRPKNIFELCDENDLDDVLDF